MAEEEKKMTRHQEYYLLNREKRNMERLAIYHNHPDTIAKREERERKKAEKENLKAEKEAAKEQLLQARIQMALERRNKKNGKATNFLVSSPPGAESSK
jgi:hypothetical protein